MLSGLSCATICYLYLTRPRRGVYASACVEGELSDVPRCPGPMQQVILSRVVKGCALHT